MIEVKNVSFSYGKENVLDNISTQFRQGEICAVLGVNGSGKTTLLRLLSRLSKPTEGSIELDGKPFSAYERKEFAKNIAMLPQCRAIPSISVYEFVSHGRFPYLGFSRMLAVRDKEMIEKAISYTGLNNMRNKNLNALSGGERQRAYIAMLIAQDTKYVILDEPTTYLDIAHNFEVMEMMCMMRDSGKGVAVVLHDLSQALKYSDKVLILENGKTAFYGTPPDAVESGSIERVFGVECTSRKYGDCTEYIFNPRASGGKM